MANDMYDFFIGRFSSDPIQQYHGSEKAIITITDIYKDPLI